MERVVRCKQLSRLKRGSVNKDASVTVNTMHLRRKTVMFTVVSMRSTLAAKTGESSAICCATFVSCCATDWIAPACSSTLLERVAYPRYMHQHPTSCQSRDRLLLRGEKAGTNMVAAQRGVFLLHFEHHVALFVTPNLAV